jgi:glycosyltransferase involved in cell wall biosynthesis
MKADPLVSVVIPAFNAEGFLAEALRSTLDQGYRPIEVIVVDDGSSDGTLAVAESFDGVNCVRQRHQGEAAARNTGVLASSGDLIAFLDADDRMTPRRLERQVDQLRRYPYLGCVFGRQELFLEPGAEPPAWARGGSVWSQLSPGSSPQDQIPPASMMARRSVFDQVGPFDTRFALSPDVDWVWRASEAGVVLAVLNCVVVHRRLHAGNATHDAAGADRAFFALVKSRIERRIAER